MTQYISANVNLTDNQIQKLRQSINANCAATSIKIGADDLDGDHTIFLTKAQINKLENARGRGKGLTIRMSSKQLKHNVKTQGGFLGALLPMLAGVGRMVAPALLGVAKKVVPALATGALSALHKFNVKPIYNPAKSIKWIIPNEIRQYVKKVNISTWEIFSQENITLKPKEVKFIMLGIGFIMSEGVILTSIPDS